MISHPFKILLLFSMLLTACSAEHEESVKQNTAEQTVVKKIVVEKKLTEQSTSKQAAIAIPDKYAAQAAEDILKAGGNAVDAAVDRKSVV